MHLLHFNMILTHLGPIDRYPLAAMTKSNYTLISLSPLSLQVIVVAMWAVELI